MNEHVFRVKRQQRVINDGFLFLIFSLTAKAKHVELIDPKSFESSLRCGRCPTMKLVRTNTIRVGVFRLNRIYNVITHKVDADRAYSKM